MPYFVYWREPMTKSQRSKAFATKREADDFRDTVSTDPRHGTYADRRPVPFQTFAEDWLTRAKPAVSPNSGVLYKWAVLKCLNIKLTMDVSGKLAGKMALGAEQAARLDTMVSVSSRSLVNTW